MRLLIGSDGAVGSPSFVWCMDTFSERAFPRIMSTQTGWHPAAKQRPPTSLEHCST